MDVNQDLSRTIPMGAARPPEAVNATPQIGQIITHFLLTEQLGKGGMGTVFLAQDTTLDRYVAIKFMDRSVVGEIAKGYGENTDTLNRALTDTLEKRFIREAKSAASISHTNLAQIYEANFDTDDWYIAMEYVQGDTLAELIQSVGTFPVEEFLSIFRQTVLGLKHAWDDYQIVHRDVKPANIMVTAQGIVKIVDLGLAKPAGTAQDKLDVTSEGVPVGTPQYMAPEQARGEEGIGCHADIFSLGATLYELCTGEKAFKGNTPAMVYDAQMKKAYKPISSMRDDLPADVVMLLEDMMNPDAASRISDYSLILERLDAAENGMGSSINELASLLGKELRRASSIDYEYYFPWRELKSLRFWRSPLLMTLAMGGIIPVVLIMLRVTPASVGWFLGGAAAYLWGVCFVRFINPRRGTRKTIFRMGLAMACVGIPLFVAITRRDFGLKLYCGELTGSCYPVWWKGIFLIGMAEEAIKMAVLVLYPIDKRVTFRAGDSIFAGVICGLVFSWKYAISFSAAMWGHHPFFSYSSAKDVIFFCLMLVVIPLLHASWGGIIGWFVHAARISGKMRWHLIIVGWLVVSLLHGIWASFSMTWGGIIATTVTFLLFLSYLRRESGSQSIMGTQRIRF